MHKQERVLKMDAVNHAFWCRLKWES